MADLALKEEAKDIAVLTGGNGAPGAGGSGAATGAQPGSPSKLPNKDDKNKRADEQIPLNVQQRAKELGINQNAGWVELEKHQAGVGKAINGLDDSLNKVLRKQEYEYLQAYNIYVKRKEKELRGLIDTLNEKNSNNNFKDARIKQLEQTIDGFRTAAFAQAEQLEALKKDIKSWKEKHKMETEEKEFYHKQALDAKRKNKLLKVAIGRLQVDKEKGHPTAMIEPIQSDSQPREKDTDTFLTGANIDDAEGKEIRIDSIENSQALVEQNLMQNQANRKGKNRVGNKSFNIDSSRKQAQTMHKRTMSQGGSLIESRYKNIPSENIKFQQFIDLIFESKMQKEDVKFEILNYVQALETNYNETVKEQKQRTERLKVSLRKEKSKNVNDVIERGDLENLFVDCVEDVRRNVIKRRLKAEIIGKKKIGKFDENSEEAKEFEESLLKLANLAKDRVKFTEFTTQDRNNLLDLFVNNEKTLLKIYEILFPRKQGAGGMNTNSLKQITSLKNSSDTIKFAGRKSDFLAGDSLHQRSVDETQAGTDLQQNSTILPSILPAMNSIQSNDIMNSMGGGKSTQIPMASPGSGMNDSLLQMASGMKYQNRPHHLAQNSVAGVPDHKGNFNIGALNQRSQQFQQLSQDSIHN